jgi:protocatechuate 3,4-dioxygenase beta subunit
LVIRDASSTRLTLQPRSLRSAAVMGARIAPELARSLRAATLDVRVTDAAGASVSSAVVDVLWLVEGRAVPVARGIAADGGRVTVDDLAMGRYVIIASSPGLSRASAIEELREQGTREVTLVTGPEATIAGTIRRDNGRSSEPSALGGVVVRVVPDGGGSEPAFAVRTSSDGTYTVRGLRPGTWRVELDDEQYEPVIRRAVPAPARSVDVVLKAFAVVRATVRDERGAAVANASVSIAGSGLWPARAETVGADGTVRLARVPSGVYELRAQMGSLVAEPIAPLLLDPGESRDVQLVLTEGAAIEGRVIDARTGAAVADARVIVAEDALSAAPRALLSEHDGAFRLRGLLRRPHVISSRATGYVPRVGDAVQPGAAQPVTVALDREVLVRGRVVDGRGAPIANAQVEISTIDLDGRPSYLNATGRAFREQLFERQQRGPAPLRPGGELGVTSGRVPHIPTDPAAVRPVETLGESGFVTDEQGRFSVGEIPPGSVRVTALHPAYVRGETALRAARAGDTLEFDVVLHAGGIVDGRLVDERGFPIAQQMIEVRVERDPVVRRAFSGRDGTFRVPSVLGRASVVAMVGGRAAARADIEVPDEQEVRVVLALDRETRRVRGRVVDPQGYPVAGAELVIAGGGHSTRAISGADGTFDALLAGRGAFSLEARHPRFAPRIVSSAAAGEELRVSLEAGATVSVHVDARSCARGDVDLAIETPCGTLHRSTRAESDVRFEQVCPGRVIVSATADGCIRATAPVSGVRSGATVDVSRVELLAGGGAEGEVVDGRGEMVAGVAIVLAESADGAALARSDRTGRFRAEALPEGDQRVVAVHPVLGRSDVATVRVLRGTVARGLRLRFARALEGAALEGATRWLAIAARAGRLVVDRVDQGSSGQRAGLRVGDMVLTVNGQAMTDASAVERRVAGGEECVVEVERGGSRSLVRVVP